MKILFIVPGSGDSFYCGNCFRDNLQASALRNAGHDVVVMPVYLPLEQTSFRADTPLFFPATSFYVAHKLFNKSKIPAWLWRLVGARPLLKIASSLSGATSAKGMEDMTLSMITGANATFTWHVFQLLSWIKQQEKPDVVHLSSALLIAIGKILKQHTHIPVVCSIQDENVWIDSMKGAYPEKAWQGIADNACFIDRFVATSEFYKNKLREKIPHINNIEVIYPGVNKNKYVAPCYPPIPTIGFFYRMNRANGLDKLAEAFVKLKKRNTIPNLRLIVGGGYTGEDNSFIKRIKKILEPYKESVIIFDNYTPEEHARFYASVSVISVPITFEESVGLYICEAFAAERPVVEPATGSFPEIVGEAGLLYQPNNSDALADALENLLTDETLYANTVRKATELSDARYNEQTLAEKLTYLYHNIISHEKECNLSENCSHADMYDGNSNLGAKSARLERPKS